MFIETRQKTVLSSEGAKPESQGWRCLRSSGAANPFICAGSINISSLRDCGTRSVAEPKPRRLDHGHEEGANSDRR